MTGRSRGIHAVDRTRRRLLVGTLAALAGAAVVTPMALAGQSTDQPEKPGQRDPASPSGGPVEFDEVYNGRRIQGRTIPGGSAHGHGQHHQQEPGPQVEVLVDGKELHVMRNADGSWISVVNHYDTFDSPRDVARAAVDELDGAALVPFA